MKQNREKLTEEHKRKISEGIKKYIKKNGHWTKGKTWEDIYSKEELKRRKERVSKKGKEHFNYGRKRPDLTERNLRKNPMKSIESQEKSSLSHKKSGKWMGRAKALRYLKSVWYCWNCSSNKNI